MKTLLKIAALAIAFVPVALIDGLFSFPGVDASAYDPALYRSGDILFVRGTSLRSRIVLFLDRTSDEYSHVGLVWMVDGVPYVVHATPSPAEGAPGGSVRIESLKEFLAPERVTQAAVFRLRDRSLRTADSAADIAVNFAAKRVPFDHDFSLSSVDELYCTEMIWRAYRTAGMDLLDGHSEGLLLPSGLVANHYLVEVARFP